MELSVNKVSLAATGFVLLVSFLAFVMPFWQVSTEKLTFENTSNTTAVGLLFFRNCDDKTGDCYYMSIPKSIISETGTDKSSRRISLYNFAQLLLNALLPILLFLAVVILEVWTLRTDRWNSGTNILCMTLLSWAAIMQWELFGPMANANVAFKLRANDYFIVHPPACVILWGLVCFLNSGITCLHAAVFIKGFISTDTNYAREM